MRLAVAEAQNNRGWSSPRPCVGCVVVRDGKLLGSGHTQVGNGTPHAEIMAIRAAWRANPIHGARGATVYTTLEPCSHFGTTPPCCDALVREDVARVVVGVEDPDARVSGRGFRRLRAAGIIVDEGILARESFRAMDDFLFHAAQSRPFVTLKGAVTLDGKWALNNGESKWITNAESREYAQKLRHQHDAILVGIETVLRDDPQLSARPTDVYKQPIRVILDSQARLSLHAKLWTDAPGVDVFVDETHVDESRTHALTERGARVHRVSTNARGELDWNSILRALWNSGIYSVLVEGGARVAGSALEAGVVNKVAWFIAPKLMGAGRALELPIRGAMSEIETLRDVRSQNLGGDVLVEGYFASEAFSWL